MSTILKFKSGFAKAVREVRKLLDKCDDCPNHRYTKVALTLDDNPVVHLMAAAGIDGYDTLFDTQIESTGDDNADDSGIIAFRAGSTHQTCQDHSIV